MLDILEVQDTLHEVAALVSFLGTVTAENLVNENCVFGYQLCSAFTTEKLQSAINSLDSKN